jgi:hypothetical protein
MALQVNTGSGPNKLLKKSPCTLWLGTVPSLSSPHIFTPGA